LLETTASRMPRASHVMKFKMKLHTRQITLNKEAGQAFRSTSNQSNDSCQVAQYPTQRQRLEFSGCAFLQRLPFKFWTQWQAYLAWPTERRCHIQEFQLPSCLCRYNPISEDETRNGHQDGNWKRKSSRSFCYETMQKKRPTTALLILGFIPMTMSSLIVPGTCCTTLHRLQFCFHVLDPPQRALYTLRKIHCHFLETRIPTPPLCTKPNV